MTKITSELANFGEACFFDNLTWLNQENWQKYFGGSLPTGVVVNGCQAVSGQYYTGELANYDVDAAIKHFRAGTIIANGIFAEYTADTDIPALTDEEVDRFIVARVYLQNGLVKIVGTTDIAADAGYTPEAFAKVLLSNESAGCIRNSAYYDIPLLYEIYGGNSYDLRRLVYLPGHDDPFIKISYLYAAADELDPVPGILYGKGFVQFHNGTQYFIDINALDQSESLMLYPTPPSSTKPTIIHIVNNSAVDKEIRLPLIWKGMSYEYEWIDQWDNEEELTYKYRELIAGDTMTISLTPYRNDLKFGYTVAQKGMSSGFTPDDYYTKAEVNTALALKANTADMDAALLLKANIADLGSLADQDTVDYITEITNKPVFGTLATLDAVPLATAVSGILPVANGGTGVASMNDLKSVLASSLFARVDVYVNSATGDDNNDGSSNHPVKTISKGISLIPYRGTVHVTWNSNTYAYGVFSVSNGKDITIDADTGVSTTARLLVQITTNIRVTDRSRLTLTGRWQIYYYNKTTGGSADCIDVDNSSTLVFGASSKIILRAWNTYNITVSGGSKFLGLGSELLLSGQGENPSYGYPASTTHKGIAVSDGSTAFVETVESDVTTPLFNAAGGIIQYNTVTGDGNKDAVRTKGGAVRNGAWA